MQKAIKVINNLVKQYNLNPIPFIINLMKYEKYKFTKKK